MEAPKNLGKILVVDDDADVLMAAQLFLKQYATLVHTEPGPARIPALMNEENYDVILLDMNFTHDVSSGSQGFYWLDRILTLDPLAVVVLITAYGDVDMAVRAIKAGAADFVLKPWQNEKLLATLSAAVAIRRSRKEVETLRSQQQQLSADIDRRFQGFVGTSQPMRRVFETIAKVARTDANILLLGENGTGKELAARELHRQSLRADKVFIPVDMAALTDTLFESELFGHVRGAFTDAREDRPGRFETASGGTLFLDEVGNLSLPLQAKLLTVLENRQVTRVGENRLRPIDIRLICATNMTLPQMVADKQFRQDLLYRINTVEIFLPPLRDRADDIPLLVDHFIGIYCRKYKRKAVRLAPATMKGLQKYAWPGNVRELQHAVERAVIMSETDLLQPSDFLLPTRTPVEASLQAGEGKLDEVEKEHIRRIISKHGGNISHAAKELGLTRAALYRRLEKHGL
ncbi:MAG TPA: sigma-54 dependent transcriptional regulator [Bacteroidota bacterium]